LARQEDLTQEIYDINAMTFVKERQIDNNMQAKIMADTIGQSENTTWVETRKNILTASKVYRIVQKKSSTSASAIVKDILFPQCDTKRKNYLNDPRAYGLHYENEARKCYEKITNTAVLDCGIFLDVPTGLLGASPDGLIGSDGLLELKCPFSARYHTNIADAISNDCIPYLKQSVDKLQLVRNSNYYFQIIFQLGITERSYCDFFVYIPNGTPGQNYYCERIFPNKTLWKLLKCEMEKFYLKCILPEIVDSRLKRKMSIRGEDFVVCEELQKLRQSFGQCVKNKRKNENESQTTPSKKRKVTKRKLAF
jgi:hypothetical protein